MNVFRCFFAEGKSRGLHACGATFPYNAPSTEFLTVEIRQSSNCLASSYPIANLSCGFGTAAFVRPQSLPFPTALPYCDDQDDQYGLRSLQ